MLQATDFLTGEQKMIKVELKYPNCESCLNASRFTPPHSLNFSSGYHRHIVSTQFTNCQFLEHCSVFRVGAFPGGVLAPKLSRLHLHKSVYTSYSYAVNTFQLYIAAFRFVYT